MCSLYSVLCYQDQVQLWMGKRIPAPIKEKNNTELGTSENTWAWARWKIFTFSLLLLQRANQSHGPHFWFLPLPSGNERFVVTLAVWVSLWVPEVFSRQIRHQSPSAPWQPEAPRTHTAQGYCIHLKGEKKSSIRKTAINVTIMSKLVTHLKKGFDWCSA